MKIRELKRTSNKTKVSVWPPSWGGSYGSGDKFAVGDVGTFKSVRRIGDRLSLTISYEGRDHSGSLEWDAPPTLDQVENLLTANVGQTIEVISELDV